MVERSAIVSVKNGINNCWFVLRGRPIIGGIGGGGGQYLITGNLKYGVDLVWLWALEKSIVLKSWQVHLLLKYGEFWNFNM